MDSSYYLKTFPENSKQVSSFVMMFLYHVCRSQHIHVNLSWQSLAISASAAAMHPCGSYPNEGYLAALVHVQLRCYYTCVFLQAGLYHSIHELVACPGTSTFLADGESSSGDNVLLLRDAGGLVNDGHVDLKHGPLMGWMVLCQMMQSVLQTLAHAEAQGVVHRDIKPQHILQRKKHYLCSFFAIIDWEGAVILSKLEEHLKLHLVSPTAGTKGYLAPEMRALHKKGAAASISEVLAATSSKLDVYSLGASIYQLVTGYCPPKDTRGGLSWPPAFPAAWPHLEQLKQLVQDCLQHDPRDRPTFAQLIQQHAAWLDAFGEQHQFAQDQTGRKLQMELSRQQRAALRPFYSSLKQQQPALYKQQKAWCKAASQLDPSCSAVRVALRQATSAVGKLGHSVGKLVSWSLERVDDVMWKLSGSGAITCLMYDRMVQRALLAGAA
jgi:hypothetical protein